MKGGKQYRQNFDKRTCRKEYGKLFKQVIEHVNRKIDKKNTNSKKVPQNMKGMKKFSVYVRKRPIFPQEIRKGEYDIVKVNQRRNSIIIHNCKMRADLKPKNAFVESVEFEGFEGVFSELSDNPEVYSNSVMSLVQFILSGKKGVLFMFGQTGSGKTHTITGMLEHIVADVFSWLEYVPFVNVTASCFEMHGDDCADLLNKREKLTLRSDQNGNIQVCGIEEVGVTNGPNLLEVIEKAFKTRKTIATKVNSVSSRSHCIFRISLWDQRNNNNLFGQLNLIDLAGSERNEDTSAHTKERIEESCKINSSLMAVKDCIRVYNQMKKTGQKMHIPYRVDKLTMLLKDSFVSKNVRTVVITTVSPNPTDTEHTLNTLKNTCLMNESSKIKTKSVNISDVVHVETNLVIHPKQWSIEETRDWLFQVGNGRYRKYVNNFPSQLDGKQLIRWNVQRFIQVCNGKEKAGTAIRKALMKEMKKFEDFKNKRSKENRALYKGN